MRSLGSVAGLCLAMALALPVGTGVGVAQASAAETISLSAAPSPTAEGLPTSVIASGVSAAYGGIFITANAAGVGCAGRPSEDDGKMVMEGDYVGAGPTYSESESVTLARGEYVLCGWLEEWGNNGSGTPLAVAAPVPLTVKPFAASVSVEVPAQVKPHPERIPEWAATITVRWQANAPASLWADVRRASLGPCAADPSAEPSEAVWLTGSELFEDTSIGPYGAESAAMQSSGSERYSGGESSAGRYLVCAWVQQGYAEPGGIAAGPVSKVVEMLPRPGELREGGHAPLDTYTGRTSQDLSIAITIAGRAVEEITYSARFRCPRTVLLAGGQRWNGVWEDAELTSESLGTLTLRGGRFRARLEGNPAMRVNISAHLAGRRISGSFEATMQTGAQGFTTHVSCHTGAVRFTLGEHGAGKRGKRPMSGGKKKGRKTRGKPRARPKARRRKRGGKAGARRRGRRV